VLKISLCEKLKPCSAWRSSCNGKLQCDFVPLNLCLVVVGKGGDFQ